jgi:hypothetical protein
MTRRVLIGNLGSARYGLQCALEGFDVITDDENDPEKFSFNSEWDGLFKIHAVGFMTANSSVAYPALGYTPFVDVRTYSAGNLLDDRYVDNGDFCEGSSLVARPDSNSMSVVYNQNLSASQNLFYLVYKVQAV